METDADASGIHTWLFGFVRVMLTTIQTHRFPTSLSRMGSPTRAAKLGIGPVYTKIGHSCTGTVRPRVISECGNTHNPRPLAYEACLKKTCADSASLDAMESASWHRKPSKSKKIRNSVSTSPGTVQYTRLGNRRSNAPLASPQDGLLSVAMGSIARACMRLHPLRELGSPRRCNRTIRKLERALGPIHYSDRSGST